MVVPRRQMCTGNGDGDGSRRHGQRRRSARTSFLAMDGALYEMAIAEVGESQTAPGSGALTGMTVVLLSSIDAPLIHRMSQQHRVADLVRQHRHAGRRTREPRADRCARASGRLSELGACQRRSRPRSARRCRSSRCSPWPSARWPASPACNRSARPASWSNRSGWRATRPTMTRLTGLLNRTAFVEAVDQPAGGERAMRRSRILYLDLDGFKEINDTLGHQTGDELLICVGERIRAVDRTSGCAGPSRRRRVRADGRRDPARAGRLRRQRDLAGDPALDRPAGQGR